MRISNLKIFAHFSAGITAVILIVITGCSGGPGNELLTGMVEVREIDTASKIPGRIDTILVKEGDFVEEGQLLAVLGTREVDAKVEQARGAMEAAKAQMDMAKNGAREEEKRAVKKMYMQAKHQFELAEKTYRRITVLYEDSVVAEQEKDMVEFRYKASREQLDAAEAQYEMIVKGAREEKIRAAAAVYHRALNAFNEARAYQDETRLVSPVSGEVQSVIADRGEIIAAGYPVISIINPDDAWVVLNIREDRLRGLQINDEYQGVIPALGPGRETFRITYIAVMADFATWKATNEKGDFDLKTFEIHAVPLGDINGFRPGMTVRMDLEAKL